MDPVVFVVHTGAQDFFICLWCPLLRAGTHLALQKRFGRCVVQAARTIGDKDVVGVTPTASLQVAAVMTVSSNRSPVRLLC